MATGSGSSSSSPHDFVEVGFLDVTESSKNTNIDKNTNALDQDQDLEEKPFRGGELKITSSSDNVPPATGQNRSTGSAVDMPDSSIDSSARPNAQLSESASEFGRRVFQSVRSAAPMTRSASRPSDTQARAFFCSRDGMFENAVEDFKRLHVKVEEDGDIRGAWLLTQIDHWDLEKEKLVLISDRWLMVVKYDFIGLSVPEIIKIPLQLIDKLVMGDLKYPASSLMPKRGASGVRAMWNAGKPTTFLQSWNPFSREVPWVTFTSHPLIWQQDRDSSTYSVDSFGESLCQAVAQCKDRHNIEGAKVEKNPIIIESYMGLVAAFHNTTNLGFFKVRGKVSF